MNAIKKKLQEEKMKQVQLLAAYYQVVDRLPSGEQRDQAIKNVLACKNQINQINQKLSEFDELAL